MSAGEVGVMQTAELSRTAVERSRVNNVEIGFVLKAYARTSETFISNEIHLLETLGVRLRIFSLMKLENQSPHAVVGRIKASVAYLPETAPLSEQSFPSWLWVHLPRFLPSHWRLMRRRPVAYLGALAEALGMSILYRRTAWSLPETTFAKDFLQAGYVALGVLESPRVRHLHAHFCHGATTVAMLASRLCRVPFSFTAHAKDIYLKELNPGNLLARKMRRAKLVVTCTEANREHLMSVCPDGGPVYTIYHGLDTETFKPLSGERPASSRDLPLILSVGRLVEKKGFDCLVRACRILQDRGCRFACRIIGGEHAYSGVIRALIAELELDGTVTISKPVTQEELKKIYAEAAVFALPCQVAGNGDRDGIPNVLTEAMAMERPVVTTNVSGIPELVRHGVNGLLIPPKDPQALADAIETLLRNPEYACRLSQCARSTICEVFDSRRNTAALRALLTGCLKD